MSSTELPGVQAAAAAVAPTVSAVRVADGERLRSVSLPGIGLNIRCRPGDRTGLPPRCTCTGSAARRRTGPR
ncbi:alpha/beta hydrolase [Streptomyces badius]